VVQGTTFSSNQAAQALPFGLYGEEHHVSAGDPH